MPKRRKTYPYKVTKVLEELREEADIKINQMAAYFGVNRDTVRDWELGYRKPPATRRLDFIVYLLDKLNLRRSKERFLEVWQEVMVNQWQWEPLTQDELWQYLPSVVKAVVPTYVGTPPFLAPPLPPYPLVGRDAILSDLKKRLFAGGTLALTALTGLPGVGKTALAVALAYDSEVLHHFRDGILWASLGRQGDIFAHLGSWALRLGLSQEEVTRLSTIEARAQAVRIHIGLRRMLLVIDDAWLPEAALTFKVGGPHCAHLLTTRHPEVAIHFAGEEMVVSELDEDDGIILLDRLASKVIAAEPSAARELVRAVGGLPLGLILIGNYLKIQAISRQPRQIKLALEQVRNVATRLQISQLQSPVERHPSLPSSVDISLQAIIAVSDESLDNLSRHAFYALSAFSPKPDTFSDAAALAVSAAGPEQIATLCASGLLEISDLDRYTIHQAIADYIRVQLGSDLEPKRRHAEFYLNFVREHSNNWQEIETELAQIQWAWQSLHQLANEQGVLDYVYAMEDFQFNRGLWQDRIVWCTRGLEAARALGRRQVEGFLLNQIGWCYRKLGATRKALDYYESALSIRRSSGDRAGEAETLDEIGIIYDDRGEFSRAVEFHQQALLIQQDLGDREKVAQTLSNLGVSYQSLGQWEQALSYLEKARALCDELQDISGQAIIFNNIANAYLHTGKYYEALELLSQAVQFNRTLGNLGSELTNLSVMGSTYYRLGDLKKAIEYYEQSRSICQKLGARRSEAVAIHNIGTVYLDLGDIERGLEFLELALPMRRDVEDRDGEAWTLMSIGRAYHLLGKSAEGIRYCAQATSIWHEIHNPVGEALGLRRIGEIYAVLGNLDQAVEFVQRALTIYRLTSDPADEAEALFRIAMIREQQDRLDEAQEYLAQAIKINETIQMPTGERYPAALARLNQKRAKKM